jgi:hypothetical protein
MKPIPYPASAGATLAAASPAGSAADAAGTAEVRLKTAPRNNTPKENTIIQANILLEPLTPALRIAIPAVTVPNTAAQLNINPNMSTSPLVQFF